jgi:hypothetical protein
MQLETIGLAHMAGENDPIEFPTEGTFQQIDEKLCSYLPKLFQYLDTLTPITESDGELPPFVVCIASGHTLDPIPQARPTGKQVMFAVGAPRSSVPNRHLFIGEFTYPLCS